MEKVRLRLQRVEPETCHLHRLRRGRGGAVGAARSIEQLRLINVELQMAPLRNAVHLQGADFFAVMQGQRSLESIEYLNEGREKVLEELVWWAQALEAARERGAEYPAAA